MNIEESSSGNLELIENYKISQKLRVYVTKIDNYDLVVRDFYHRNRIDVKVENNEFKAYSCRVLSVHIDGFDYDKFDSSIDAKQIYQALKDKGYIFDDNYELAVNYQNPSIKNGLVISLGVYGFGFKNIDHVSYRKVIVDMELQESANTGYQVGIFDITESRNHHFPDFKLERALEWGLIKIPKCVQSKW